MNKANLFTFLTVCIIVCSCQKKTEPNKVPDANAGPSVMITLPTNSVTLNGTGTDADGHITAYLWSQISGPSAANIVNQGSASTEITNFIAGTYVFQLMVVDNMGTTGVDTASILVNPSIIQTLTLQPDNNPFEYQVTELNGQDASFFGPEISIDTWTSSNQPWTLRDIFKFDLSTIPANAKITSANLYLYSNPQPLTGNLVNANFGTSNSLVLQQVTQSWSTSTISWFNQPSTTTTNQIIIPSTTQSILDLNLDVTGIVSSMVSNNANYGFLLKLQTEVTYNSRIFISSYNTNYTQSHPKLVVVYQ
jgi:hypothetical protein